MVSLRIVPPLLGNVLGLGMGWRHSSAAVTGTSRSLKGQLAVPG
jgi:hypothetical protein